MHYDTTILGAGAAGLFCAGLLTGRGLRVLLVDHAPEPGRKILISGGGRANFTNLNTQPEHFLSENPHFAKSALACYTPQQFVALVERHGIAYHAKTPGQLFCDGSARQIVDMLLAECSGAELRLHTEIVSLNACADGFTLDLRDSSSGSPVQVTSRSVVVATGGLSIPKLGATGIGYDLARQFGLRVVQHRPALVPFTFNPDDAARFEGLSGVATEVELTLAPSEKSGNGNTGAKQWTAQGRLQQRSQGRTPTRAPIRFRDKLLITHRGLSGPAVLQISSYWQPGSTLTLDLAPDREVTAPLMQPQARRDQPAALTAWSSALPRRLAERLLTLDPPRAWTNEALHTSERTLHNWPLTPGGTEGYAKAEVTAGGVSTASLHAQTLEARQVPGLYFIGEVVDVTGHLGGYNFQWAWASAAAAAEAIVNS